jgi:citrate lyase subunit beta/citryl-CoA lyase
LRLHDLDGLAADCTRSRALGFGGRLVIYPSHVEPAIRRYLGFDDTQLERFTNIVNGFEEAIAQGSAALQVDGELVDYPIYHRARRSLAAARRLAQL